MPASDPGRLWDPVLLCGRVYPFQSGYKLPTQGQPCWKLHPAVSDASDLITQTLCSTCLKIYFNAFAIKLGSLGTNDNGMMCYFLLKGRTRNSALRRHRPNLRYTALCNCFVLNIGTAFYVFPSSKDVDGTEEAHGSVCCGTQLIGHSE